MNITESGNQTSTWRREQEWFQGGKKNECEKYQKTVIKDITDNDIENTRERLHIDDLYIGIKNSAKTDCFVWSENFDGKQVYNNHKNDYRNDCFYYNLKMICENGGFQKRTLKDIYYFIRTQLFFLKKESLRYEKDHNIYMINILDGKYCDDYKQCFEELINRKEFRSIKKYFFFGDMYNFRFWYNKYLKN